jgi:hypothetical protein
MKAPRQLAVRRGVRKGQETLARDLAQGLADRGIGFRIYLATHNKVSIRF